jgi:probable F420-dependent oxidoreductase
MNQQFGTYGAWLHPDLGNSSVEYATELEDLGFRTLWVGVGAGPIGDMRLIDEMLAATRTATIASAIVNMWRDDADGLARHYHRLADRHGGRFLLGVGLGHPETRSNYDKPFQRITEFIDTLLHQQVPSDSIVIGALGARTLELAGERTRGAHPYLTVPAHTRFARKTLGSGVFLAPEHKVVLTEDVEHARRIGRPAVQFPYLGLRNYTNNLMRHGFSAADIAGSGSDRLIDALVAHGTPEAIYRRLDEHLVAGADHVGIQVLTGDPDISPMPAFRTLALHRPA